MEMRTGGQTGGADAAELLPGEDRLTWPDQRLGEVAVERRHPAAVVEQDVDAAGPGLAGADHDSSGRCEHGRSGRGGEVQARVEVPAGAGWIGRLQLQGGAAEWLADHRARHDLAGGGR